MGKLMLNQVIQALRSAGMAVERGYPGDQLASITKPVCAVNLLSADLRNQTATSRVTVLSPAALGAATCENAALDVAAVLAGSGGKCNVSDHTFDGRADLFAVEVTAQFPTNAPKLRINDVPLAHAVAFTYWRAVDDEHPVLEEAPWGFRLEEFFPSNVDDDAESEAQFTLGHITYSGLYTFSDCCWTYVRRIWGADGIKQIRLGTAKSLDLS